MKMISRDHKFENGMTVVKMGVKYFYTYHEKDKNWRSMFMISEEGRKAFISQDWEYFLEKEANYWGGTLK